MIIRYFASRQKKQECNWYQIDIWAFRSSLPTGRQASKIPINKENKTTGAIADITVKNHGTHIIQKKNKNTTCFWIG